MTQTTINIEGISCGECEKSITNMISKQEGVESILVSKEAKNAVINHDPSIINLARLNEIIEDMGFDVV